MFSFLFLSGSFTPKRNCLRAAVSASSPFSMLRANLQNGGCGCVFLWRTLVERFPESARCVHYFSKTGGG